METMHSEKLPSTLRSSSTRCIKGFTTNSSACRKPLNELCDNNLGLIYSTYPRYFEQPNTELTDEHCKLYHEFHEDGMVFGTPVRIARQFAKPQDSNLGLIDNVTKQRHENHQYRIHQAQHEQSHLIQQWVKPEKSIYGQGHLILDSR